MGKKQFNEKILAAVREFFKENAEVTIREIVKNNGVLLDGLLITEKNNNLSPAIYLNTFYEEYEKGKALGSIVYEIIKLYDASKVEAGIDMEFFYDYRRVRTRIFCKIVNYEKNREQLQDVPYLRFLDLAAVCYYSYMNDILGSGTIVIHTSHIRKWQIEEEELFAYAMQNTRRLLDYDCKEMNEVIRELLAGGMKEGLNKFLESIQEDERKELSSEWKNDIMEHLLQQVTDRSRERPMYILTNKCRYLGAACLLFQDILQEVADKMASSYYILPSSVHELILVPDGGEECRDRLYKMVGEVNTTQVEPEEILSDAVYYYDRHAQEAILLS